MSLDDQEFRGPRAEFVFLPPDTDWTGIHHGTVFDVPGCELGHQGEDVSFDAVLRKYRLTDPALALLAQIVRAHGFSALGFSDAEILGGSSSSTTLSMLSVANGQWHETGRTISYLAIW